MNATLELDEQLADELKKNTIAVSMQLKKFGNTKKLDEESHAKAAGAISASTDRIKATEVIVNSKHPAYKAVTSHISKIKRSFIDQTVSYPEPTIRLMNIDKLDTFQADVDIAIADLDELVDDLNRHREEIIEDARLSLGTAFKPEYYPPTFTGLFSIEVTYPTIGPDERLKQLNPKLYEEQERRFRQQMELAISETTTALATELERIFLRISESVAEGRTIRSNMFDPLNNFLERFEDLRLGSRPEIREVVEKAREILGNADSTAVARSATARANLASALAPLSENISNFTQIITSRQIDLSEE